VVYTCGVRGLCLVLVAVTTGAFTFPASSQAPPSLESLLAQATTYVTSYERAFSLLVSEEHYVQEIRRPINPGSNLSRTNPGGGITGGDVVRRQVTRSDYLLVQLGEGAGWMPFRDVFELNASKVRDREDRLAKLFLANDATRFDQADRIMAESTRHNIGSITRTINIPTLAMMFLHPRVRDRFAFSARGEETVAGIPAVRVSYRESARPTLMKTTRERDLPLDGELWIDRATGAIVKSVLNAGDPAVRAAITVTYRRDAEAAIWVPDRMDEYYREPGSSNEIFTTATYTNVRKFQVNTNEKITKPPGSLQ
jgi:hypothetical protein